MIRRIASFIPMSRELAIERGLVEPTPEERAALDANRAKWAAWQERQRARHDKGRRDLYAIGGSLTWRLLDLHAADDEGRCQGDDFDGTEAERPEWPCRTVDEIAKHLGVTLEEPAP